MRHQRQRPASRSRSRARRCACACKLTERRRRCSSPTSPTANANGVSGGPARLADQGRRQRPRFTLPADTKFPVTITVLAGDRDQRRALQKDGVVVFKSIDADYSATVASPPSGPAEAGRAVLGRRHHQRQGRLVVRRRSPTSSSPPRHPTLAKVGIAALKRIRATNPDLVVLNGDITDIGAAEDLTLARRRSRQGGCELIPLTSTIGTRRHAGPDRRQDPVLLRAGQPRVLPRERPGRPGAVHRRVRRSPTARSTTTARASSCSPAPTARCAAPTGRSCRCSRRRSTTPRPTRRSRTSWSSPTTRSTTRPRSTRRSSATATRSRWSRSC